MRIAKVTVVLMSLLTQACSFSVDTTDPGGDGGSGATGLSGGASAVSASSGGPSPRDEWERVDGVEATGGSSAPKDVCIPVDAASEVSTTLESPDFGIAQFAIAKLRAGQLPNPIELPTAPFLEYFRSLVPASSDGTQTSVTAEYSFLDASTPTAGRVDLTVRAPAKVLPRSDGHFVFAVRLTPAMPLRGPLLQALVARGVRALVDRKLGGYFSVVVVGEMTTEVIAPTPIEAGVPTDLFSRLESMLAVDALAALPSLDSGATSLDALWLAVKDFEEGTMFLPKYREYVFLAAGDTQFPEELASEVRKHRAAEFASGIDVRLHAVEVAPSLATAPDDPVAVHHPELTNLLSRAGEGYGLYVDDALLDATTPADFALSQAEFALFVPALRGVQLSLVAPPNAWFEVPSPSMGGDGAVALAGTLEAGAAVRRSVPMGACSSDVTGGAGTLLLLDPVDGSAFEASVSFDGTELVEQARERAVSSVVFALRGTQDDFCTRFFFARSLIDAYELASSPDSNTQCPPVPAAIDACTASVPIDAFGAACCLGARLRGVLASADALAASKCMP
jgi:hypothetical protein